MTCHCCALSFSRLGYAKRKGQLQEKDAYAKELEDLIPQMEQLVADKQSQEAQLNGQEPELKRLRDRCSQLQGHLEREQAAGHQVLQRNFMLPGGRNSFENTRYFVLVLVVVRNKKKGSLHGHV